MIILKVMIKNIWPKKAKTMKNSHFWRVFFALLFRANRWAQILTQQCKGTLSGHIGTIFGKASHFFLFQLENERFRGDCLMTEIFNKNACPTIWISEDHKSQTN